MKGISGCKLCVYVIAGLDCPVTIFDAIDAPAIDVNGELDRILESYA